ncbi:hypothetical protein DJ69_13475 [Halorubrum persicum]|uniref:HNH nuclease domain-containing protein n=1 Tax=Halorubrum persicum TaxID=1383844 RepID=A0A2G1WGI3_9EURY|nr:HNH endonuclease [Halorubrum persicum]PHQ38092.1 hypothetical protein DJ69_13475 [Halorubrum persicum]
MTELKDMSDTDKVKELYEEMNRVDQKVDGPITQRDMKEHSKHSLYHYRKYFGSWNDAKKKLGFEIDTHQNISEEDLINELHRLKGEVDGIITPEDMTEKGKYASNTYKRTFGTWQKAKRKANLQTLKVDKQDLLDELERLAEEKQKSPNIKDMKEDGKYSIASYRKYFGTWNKAKEKVDLETKSVAPGKDHYEWSGGNEWYYGPSSYVEKQKAKVRKRDNDKCRVCGFSHEDRNNDVHHIKPKSKFGDLSKPENYEPLNDTENMITLCYHCHKKYEGRFQDTDPDGFERLAKSLENNNRRKAL